MGLLTESVKFKKGKKDIMKEKNTKENYIPILSQLVLSISLPSVRFYLKYVIFESQFDKF